MRSTAGGVVVPNRLTDTETQLKISEGLPLWFNQKKRKYLKHMLHLFNTGIAMFVGDTHAYLIKIKTVEIGETPKHIEMRYLSSMIVKLDAEQEGGITYFSSDEGLSMLKTGNKGETHVLLDHFANQKLQPQNCKCQEKVSPCKCYMEPRKLLMADPSVFQQFTGTTGGC
ncbi:uncharacterized protein LOC129590064 [Paramacrobiotus metropolitanus]|uniref:uncharacterized protein LOC129590064 n=1 Tax=Paramacrobiotus metropolitanus TaxID=2943436 RepID=UPI00244627A8|nr:uncharacterized protein LOC129590064 [Paramacrobiotus metropolitanus]